MSLAIRTSPGLPLSSSSVPACSQSGANTTCVLNLRQRVGRVVCMVDISTALFWYTGPVTACVLRWPLTKLAVSQWHPYLCLLWVASCGWSPTWKLPERQSQHMAADSKWQLVTNPVPPAVCMQSLHSADPRGCAPLPPDGRGPPWPQGESPFHHPRLVSLCVLILFLFWWTELYAK